MEPEYFQYLLMTLLSVAKARPSNLLLVATEINQELVEMARESSEESGRGDQAEKGAESEESGCGDQAEKGAESGETERLAVFIQLLNDVFWKLFVQRAASPATAPVINPGNEACVCVCLLFVCCLFVCLFVGVLLVIKIP